MGNHEPSLTNSIMMNQVRTPVPLVTIHKTKKIDDSGTTLIHNHDTKHEIIIIIHHH